MITPLADAHAGEVYGGKAVQLGSAIRAGLPVPPGYALSADAAGAAVDGHPEAIAAIERVSNELGLMAVRSSALDEDSADASFAGAHLSVLAVSGRDPTIDAVREVHASGVASHGYRTRLGLDLTSRMAVVIQQLVDADVAGVLFTRNPVTGADERVIEAGWGLGEAVVSGLITPDRYRLSRGGRELERTPGEKDLAIRPRRDAAGGQATEEVPVAADDVHAFCLAEAHLAALDELAFRCDEVFGSTDHDIEFAFRHDEVFLLQRRPITRA